MRSMHPRRRLPPPRYEAWCGTRIPWLRHEDDLVSTQRERNGGSIEIAQEGELGSQARLSNSPVAHPALHHTYHWTRMARLGPVPALLESSTCPSHSSNSFFPNPNVIHNVCMFPDPLIWKDVSANDSNGDFACNSQRKPVCAAPEALPAENPAVLG